MYKIILKTVIVGALMTLLSHNNYAQVGIGTTTPNADAELDITSTTRGVLLPRILLTNTTSPAPLSTDVAGMLVYNTATAGDVTPGFYYNDGSDWIRLGDGWSITGNTGTTAGANFIGTTDAQDVVIKANNIEHLRIGQTETVFNEDSEDYDFKVESDNEPNMLFVNGGTDQVLMKANTHHLGYTDSFAAYSSSSALDYAVTGWHLGTSGGGGNFVIEDITNGLAAMEASTDGPGVASKGLIVSSTTAAWGTEGTSNDSDSYGVYGSVPTTGSWLGFGGYFTGGLAYENGLYDLSDERAKRDIKKIQFALDKILNINGYTYKYDERKFNKNAISDEDVYYGFTAQNIKKSLPHAVAEKTVHFRNQHIKARSSKKDHGVDTTLNVVDYTAIIPVLVEAMKEQQKMIQSLKDEIEALKEK